MSEKRKKPRKGAISRRFAPEILRRAREIAAEYQIVIAPEDDYYFGRGLEMPGAMGDGKTPDECVAGTREAMIANVAYMLEKGEAPPTPASKGARSVQINVRLTAEEKLTLEALAKERGFSGISDYVRAAALAGST